MGDHGNPSPYLYTREPASGENISSINSYRLFLTLPDASSLPQFRGNNGFRNHTWLRTHFVVSQAMGGAFRWLALPLESFSAWFAAVFRTLLEVMNYVNYLQLVPQFPTICMRNAQKRSICSKQPSFTCIEHL
jgi:hypothetical protein